MSVDGINLPGGGETRVLYEVQTPGLCYPFYESEAAAWHKLADIKGWPDKPPVRIVKQTVTRWPDGRAYYSPWEHVGGDVWEGQ